MVYSPMRVRKYVDIDVPGLGQKIKEARLNSRKSVTALAKEAGVARTTWYDLENETLSKSNTVLFDTLRKIEKALGVDFGVRLDD